MFYALLYAVIRRILRLGWLSSDTEAEVMVLRHELAMLRSQIRRPRWRRRDKLFLAATSRMLPRRSHRYGPRMLTTSVVLSALAMVLTAVLSLIPAPRTSRKLDIGRVVRERAAKEHSGPVGGGCDGDDGTRRFVMGIGIRERAHDCNRVVRCRLEEASRGRPVRPTFAPARLKDR